jgi:translation initiation factor 3 subunit B
MDRFKQFLWRPRPRTLLSKEHQRQIRKGLREYSRAFDEEDAAEDAADSADLIAQRKRLVDEWNAWRARCKKELTEDRHGKFATHDHAADEDKEEIEVWIEEVIEQTEEIIE